MSGAHTLHLVVLAAGFATRLYPLTEHRAKPLLEVGGRPLLSHVVDGWLATATVHGVTVVSNARFHDDFVRWRAGCTTALPVEVLDDGAHTPAEALGALRDLRLALWNTRIPAGAGYVVAGGDNLLDFDLAPFARRYLATRRTLLPLRRVEGPVPPRTYAEADLREDGMLRALREKPDDPRTPYAAICLYLVPPALREWLDRYLDAGGNPDSPGHFFAWLVDREPVEGRVFAGRWFDIGTPETLAAARRAFAGRAVPPRDA